MTCQPLSGLACDRQVPAQPTGRSGADGWHARPCSLGCICYSGLQNPQGVQPADQLASRPRSYTIHLPWRDTLVLLLIAGHERGLRLHEQLDVRWHHEVLLL
jgi:hypothetical protein